MLDEARGGYVAGAGTKVAAPFSPLHLALQVMCSLDGRTRATATNTLSGLRNTSMFSTSSQFAWFVWVVSFAALDAPVCMSLLPTTIPDAGERSLEQQRASTGEHGANKI